MSNDLKPWQVLSKRTLYSSPWINLDQWAVRLPDGSIIPDHHVLDYPRAAVGVIPIGADGRILMIDHYRFMTDTRGWEIPSGGIDQDEDRPLRGADALSGHGECLVPCSHTC